MYDKRLANHLELFIAIVRFLVKYDLGIVLRQFDCKKLYQSNIYRIFDLVTFFTFVLKKDNVKKYLLLLRETIPKSTSYFRF